MKFFSFFFVFAFICVLFAQTEGAARKRRQEPNFFEQVQKSVPEGFETIKKAVEDFTSKIDLKQLQRDFTSRLDEFSKSFGQGSEGQSTQAPPASAATPSP